MSSLAPKRVREAHKPWVSPPQAVHCHGCPITVNGRDSGPCDCGAEEAQRIADAFWKESGLAMKIQNEVAERVKPSGDVKCRKCGRITDTRKFWRCIGCSAAVAAP